MLGVVNKLLPQMTQTEPTPTPGLTPALKSSTCSALFNNLRENGVKLHIPVSTYFGKFLVVFPLQMYPADVEPFPTFDFAPPSPRYDENLLLISIFFRPRFLHVHKFLQRPNNSMLLTVNNNKEHYIALCPFNIPTARVKIDPQNNRVWARFQFIRFLVFNLVTWSSLWVVCGGSAAIYRGWEVSANTNTSSFVKFYMEFMFHLLGIFCSKR